MALAWKIVRYVFAGLLVCILLFAAFLAGRYWWWQWKRTECPVLVWLKPLGHHSVTAADYIELESGGGLSTWNPIDIRVYGDGRVERNTSIKSFDGEIYGCPLRDADKHLHIPAKTAIGLISRANDGGFCRLCARYFPNETVFDAGSSTITLAMSGNAKSVWVRYVKAPPIFGELYGRISAISPMNDLADRRGFNPERTAECDRFHEKQDVINEQLEAKWRSEHPSD